VQTSQSDSMLRSQLIPWISSLTFVTTAIPLGSVLGLTAIKDIYDDVVSDVTPSRDRRTCTCIAGVLRAHTCANAAHSRQLDMFVYFLFCTRRGYSKVCVSSLKCYNYLLDI